MAETSQKTLIDITALKYFYKSLQNVTVLIAPSTVEAASSSNLGHTYFIPADGTYAGVKCDKGDHIVSNGTTWVRIPKGTGSGEGTTYYAGTGIDISTVDGKDTIANTGVLAVEEADDTNKGAVKVTTKDGSSYVPVHGLGTAAYADVTDTYAEDGTVPVSGKAVKSAISGKLDASEKGANGGVAELDESGKVLSSQLPSYVDDVIEATSKSEFPTTGESGKIYVDTTTNLSYRWAGTDYVEISPSIALGETSATAFRGDHGKTAYDHATTTETNPHGTTKSDVGLGNVDNTSDTDKPISTATQTALNGKVPTTRKVNGKALSADVTLSGADVAVTGYAKASTASAIAATDTVNVALGKVEKALDGKAASSHNQASNTITAMTGYSKATTASAISTSDSLNAAVGKLEKKVDDKVQKTSVSSSNETTSVINVTDAKAQMAMVKSISGKTIRANIFSGYTTMGKYTAATEKYNGHDCITSTQSWGGAYDSNVVLKSGKTYTISAAIKTSVAGSVYLIYGGTGVELTHISIPSANTWTRVSVTYTPTSDLNNIRIESQSAVTTTISEFMITEGEQLISYCSPSSLASAPVESVVSHSANKFDYNNTTKENVDASGNITSNPSMVLSDYMPVNGNFAASWNKGSSGAYMRFAMYDSNKKFIKREDVSAVSNTFATKSNTGYVRICFEANGVDKESIALYNGTENRGFIQYNKTTVLVPSEARNCVGYGLGIDADCCNVVDFENGIHQTNCLDIDLGSLGWHEDGSGTGRFYSDPVSNALNVGNDANANWICGKYTRATYNAIAAKTADMVYGGIDSVHRFWIRDTSKTEATLKTSLAGVHAVYPLIDSAKITKPLTDFIRPLPVEAGGTLTLVNEHNLDMPSVIKYKKEV